MVMVFMMYSQFSQVFMGKFTGAATTYPGIELERLASIGLFSKLLIAAGFGNDLIQFVLVRSGCF